MKRLTNKSASGHYDLEVPSTQDCAGFEQKCFDKLGQLEDIEEGLGIELLILLKALKQGHIYSAEFGETDIDLFFPDHDKWSFDDSKGNLFYVKDYGKTWALTKEELE